MLQKLRDIDNIILKDLISKSDSIADVLRKLDMNDCAESNKSFIRKFVKDNDIQTKHFRRISKLEKDINELEFSQLIKKCNCWSEVMRGLGIPFHGNIINSLRKMAIRYNIDFSHFDVKAAYNNRLSSKQPTNEELFIDDNIVSRSVIKSRLLKQQLIEYKCSSCNNDGYWQDKKLVLQLEHKNGKRNDDRLENLCFLCPNCHSQTATFCGKNSKR